MQLSSNGLSSTSEQLRTPDHSALCDQYLRGLTKSPDTVGGFDHGVGHPLLLLYDAKIPHGQNINKFNGLGDDPFNALKSLF